MNVRLRSDIIAAASGFPASIAADRIRSRHDDYRVLLEALEYAIDVARSEDDVAKLRQEDDELRGKINRIERGILATLDDENDS